MEDPVAIGIPMSPTAAVTSFDDDPANPRAVKTQGGQLTPPPPPPGVGAAGHQAEEEQQSNEDLRISRSSRSSRESKGSRSSGSNKGTRSSSSKNRESKSMSPRLRRKKRVGTSGEIASDQEDLAARSLSLSKILSEMEHKQTHPHVEEANVHDEGGGNPQPRDVGTLDDHLTDGNQAEDVGDDKKKKIKDSSRHSKSSRGSKKTRSSTSRSRHKSKSLSLSLSPTLNRNKERRRLTSSTSPMRQRLTERPASLSDIAKAADLPDLAVSSPPSAVKKRKKAIGSSNHEKGSSSHHKSTSPKKEGRQSMQRMNSPTWIGTVDEVEIAEALEHMSSHGTSDSSGCGNRRSGDGMESNEVDLFDFLAEGRKNSKDKNGGVGIARMDWGFMSDSRLAYNPPSSTTTGSGHDSDEDSGSGAYCPSTLLRRPSYGSLSSSSTNDNKSPQKQQQQQYDSKQNAMLSTSRKSESNLFTSTSSMPGSPGNSLFLRKQGELGLQQKLDLMNRSMAVDATTGAVSPGKTKKKLSLFSTALALNRFRPMDSDDELDDVANTGHIVDQSMKTTSTVTTSSTFERELEIRNHSGEKMELSYDGNDEAFDALFDDVIKSNDVDDPNTREHLEWEPVVGSQESVVSSSDSNLLSPDIDKDMNTKTEDAEKDRVTNDNNRMGNDSDKDVITEVDSTLENVEKEPEKEVGRVERELASKRNAWTSKSMNRLRRSVRSLKLQRHKSLKDLKEDIDEKKRRRSSSLFGRFRERSSSKRDLNANETKLKKSGVVKGSKRSSTAAVTAMSDTPIRSDEDQKGREKELKALEDSLRSDGLLGSDERGLHDDDLMNVYSPSFGSPKKQRSKASKSTKSGSSRDCIHNDKTNERGRSRKSKAKSERKSHTDASQELQLEDLARSIFLQIEKTKGLGVSNRVDSHDETFHQSAPSVLQHEKAHHKSAEATKSGRGVGKRKKDDKRKTRDGREDLGDRKQPAEVEKYGPNDLPLEDEEFTETTQDDESEFMPEDGSSTVLDVQDITNEENLASPKRKTKKKVSSKEKIPSPKKKTKSITTDNYRNGTKEVTDTTSKQNETKRNKSKKDRNSVSQMHDIEREIMMQETMNASAPTFLATDLPRRNPGQRSNSLRDLMKIVFTKLDGTQGKVDPV